MKIGQISARTWRKKSNNSAKLFAVATITRQIRKEIYCSLPHFSSILDLISFYLLFRQEFDPIVQGNCAILVFQWEYLSDASIVTFIHSFTFIEI